MSEAIGKVGTYTYKKFYGYDGTAKVFRQHSMRVEIVDEKYTRYRVKYLGADFSKGAPATLHWVQKKNVTLDVSEFEARVTQRDEIAPPIRLPYKDSDD